MPNSSGLNEAAIDTELCDRELEVLQRMAMGRSNGEISDELHLARGTINHYINNVYAKLSVEDRTMATILALRRGLIE